MTDIIVLHNFSGLKRGRIVALEPWMLDHVAAGNAKMLPDNIEEQDDGGGPQTAPEVLQGASTGAYDDIDEGTAALLDEEE